MKKEKKANAYPVRLSVSLMSWVRREAEVNKRSINSEIFLLVEQAREVRELKSIPST